MHIFGGILWVREHAHLKICKGTANKQCQSQRVLKINVSKAKSVGPSVYICMMGCFRLQEKPEGFWPLWVNAVSPCSKLKVSVIFSSLKSLACCLESKYEKASEWLNHISAVPCEELSTCHQPHYQQSALHRRGQTAQPSPPFFSFHLLLPFRALFLPSFLPKPLSHSFRYFLSLSDPLTLARKTDMWNFPVFQQAEGGRDTSRFVSIQCHCSFLSFWPKQSNSIWKNQAAPDSEIQHFWFLVQALNSCFAQECMIWGSTFIALSVF